MNNIIIKQDVNIPDKFTVILNKHNKLYTTTIDDNLNTKLNTYVEIWSPFIKDKWNLSYTNRFFRTTQNMNGGIYHHKYFNDYNNLYKNEQFIVKTAYELLEETGFKCNPNEGIIMIDIFHMDSDEPVDSKYAITCDNDIDQHNEYNTCVFYVRKDHYVKGDLDVYSEPPATILPSIFGQGEKIVIPTKTNFSILRDGELQYQIQPHSGHGVEHILTICFVKV